MKKQLLQGEMLEFSNLQDELKKLQANPRAFEFFAKQITPTK